MGVVYLSRHPQLGFEVAIKVLLTGTARPEQLQRFRRELDALSQLQHPGLVDVLEAGELEGRPWFAMRRVPGQNLEHRLQTRGPLAPAEVLELGGQLCRAVAHAHERGLLHRDLKPDNVLCGPNGYVVTDFGLTKSLEDESQSLSKTGALQGTPGYWAPEQASGKGKVATPETDVYGVGATLYAALTGEPPIKGASMLELVVATCDRPPLPPSQLVSVPKPLEAVILRCLAKAPQDRFGSLRELEAELERVESELAARPRPRWIGPAAGVLALALGGIAAAPFLAPEDAPTPASPMRASASPSAAHSPSPPVSSEVSLEEIRRAAESGQTEAMVSLAGLLIRGEQVPADRAAGLRWYRRAAEAGNPRAMVSLGVHLLADGEVRTAVGLFRRAAEAGDPAGMCKLGVSLLSQPGYSKRAGVSWLQRAAEAGDGEAMANLGSAYAQGVGVEKDLTLAATWYRKSADAGHHQGMARLAYVYSNGRGVEKDLDLALEWCRKSIAAGSTAGLLYLGDAYQRGIGVEQDHAEAARLYRQALDAGDSIANFCLGQLYERGHGVPEDPAQAARLYAVTAREGHPPSVRALARLYVEGRGVPRDVAKGLSLYRQAAERGEDTARYSYGVILYNGVLTPRDLRTARRHLGRATGTYPALFAFLCEAELSDLNTARRQIRTFAIKTKPTLWRGDLIGFVLGEIEEESLLRRAEESPEGDLKARLCEANFYIGALRALKGDREGAEGFLRTSLEHRVEGYKEVSAAEALLKRIREAR